MTRVEVLSQMQDPRLSVILATDRYETIRHVVARLTAQTVSEQIEIVIVTPPDATIDLDAPSLQRFAAVRRVETGAVLPLAPARAAGVLAATAPVICIGETHSFPHTDWAEALIRAHAGPWAMVVPGFGNANPENALSWAAFLRDYGRWMDGLPAGETAVVPPYNTAVKREALLAFGDRLTDAVSQGDQMVLGLRARGQRAYFEPAAKIDHANVSRAGPWIAQRYIVGRALAAARLDRWSWARRALYVAGSPLIPAVVLGRLLESLRVARRTQHLPNGTMPALVVGAVLSAVGEMFGYALGATAGVVLGSDEYELHKMNYTSGRIRAAPARG